MDEMAIGYVCFGTFITKSKYKPNKGVVTRNNSYCHNDVIIDEQLSEKSIIEERLIFLDIPAYHLPLFSTLLHL